MQVKSITECSIFFRPSLSYHLSLRSDFFVIFFLSGRLRQVFTNTCCVKLYAHAYLRTCRYVPVLLWHRQIYRCLVILSEVKVTSRLCARGQRRLGRALVSLFVITWTCQAKGLFEHMSITTSSHMISKLCPTCINVSWRYTTSYQRRCDVIKQAPWPTSEIVYEQWELTACLKVFGLYFALCHPISDFKDVYIDLCKKLNFTWSGHIINCFFCNVCHQDGGSKISICIQLNKKFDTNRK